MVAGDPDPDLLFGPLFLQLGLPLRQPPPFRGVAVPQAEPQTDHPGEPLPADPAHKVLCSDRHAGGGSFRHFADRSARSDLPDLPFAYRSGGARGEHADPGAVRRLQASPGGVADRLDTLRTSGHEPGHPAVLLSSTMPAWGVVGAA